MADLTRRVHILLKEDQWEYLKNLSELRQKPVGELMREAVESAYRPRSDARARFALKNLGETAFLEDQNLSELRQNLGISTPGERAD